MKKSETNLQELHQTISSLHHCFRATKDCQMKWVIGMRKFKITNLLLKISGKWNTIMLQIDWYPLYILLIINIIWWTRSFWLSMTSWWLYRFLLKSWMTSRLHFIVPFRFIHAWRLGRGIAKIVFFGVTFSKNLENLLKIKLKF